MSAFYSFKKRKIFLRKNLFTLREREHNFDYKIIYNHSCEETCGLLILTTLISVGFGALNRSLSIAGDVEYTQDLGNMMRSWINNEKTDFHNSSYKTKKLP